jgi:hypothetical protein
MATVEENGSVVFTGGLVIKGDPSLTKVEPVHPVRPLTAIDMMKEVLAGSLVHSPKQWYDPAPPKGNQLSGQRVFNALTALFPGAIDKEIRCPACDKSGTVATRDSVIGMVPHLNDKHWWTREKIADWMETLDVDLTLKDKEA